MPIELNELFVRANQMMESTNRNIFITGKAGTGKSTLLDYFRKHTKKKIAVLAPTGVAAVNIQGQTIHSFFSFRPGITPEKVKKAFDSRIYKKLDCVVIDEISMVRADLLDCVEKFLRINGKHKGKPFGGIQMIFFGDLYQLPPVVAEEEKKIFSGHYKSQYFFDSHAFIELGMEFIELEKIYRQKDQDFIHILNSIRNNTVSEEQLKELNKRVKVYFEPKANEFFVQLTTTNALADQKNQIELEKLRGNALNYKGEMNGKFESLYLPTERELNIKPGAQIMMLNNDKEGRWVNGTMGRVLGIEDSEQEGDVILVQLEDGKKQRVERYTWKLYKMEFNQLTNTIENNSIGSFTQYPVKLAWAITIHKSQGKTFDRAVIDFGPGTFAHGQAYVALSRCTSLEGMVLTRPIQKKDIMMDWKVVQFITNHQYQLSEEKIPLKDKVALIQKAIDGKTKLDITYLRRSDEKSRRTIEPTFVGELKFEGRPFVGMEAYCHTQKGRRTFRVDRILEIRENSGDK